MVGNYSPTSHCLCFNLLHPFFWSPFPCTSSLARLKPLLSFLPSWFPTSRCPSISGWYKWEECSHGGEQGPSLALLRAGLGLMGTAFAFPSQPRLGQGLLSRCPNHPQLWLQSRTGAAHPPVSRAGQGRTGGRKRFCPATPDCTHQPCTRAGICSRLWSCKYLPLLLLKTCPRG